MTSYGPNPQTPHCQLGKDAKVNPQTIHNIIAGRTWCDLPALWKLECELDERLWVNTEVEQDYYRRRPRRI